jgi:hypothetical protein
MWRKEREVPVSEALGIMKSRLRSDRLERFHDQAREEVLARVIALEQGLCGECEMVIPKLGPVAGNREGIALACKAGEDPVSLYRTFVYDPLVEPPPCQFFASIENEE